MKAPTPLPQDPAEALKALALEVKTEIEKRFKHRGWTTGKKLWEQRLLQRANEALTR